MMCPNDSLISAVSSFRHTYSPVSTVMVMIVDWSGSMCNQIVDTVIQTINLAMFCRKVGIPFSVQIFANAIPDFSTGKPASTTEQNTYSVHNRVTMDLVTGHTVSLGYPYGVIPRMFMAWLGREIKQRKSREIELAGNMSAFMRDIGIDSVTGGKNGSIQAVKRQLQRLAASRITLLTVEPGAASTDYSTLEGMLVADKADFWWSPDKNQDSLFETRLILSEKFYNAFSTAVPVDLRIMRLLNQSPLELDLYCWLTYRLCFMKKRTMVPWEALQGQFGTETQEPRKFRWLVRKALRSVREVYPAARLDDSGDEGLILSPSPPSISLTKPIDRRA